MNKYIVFTALGFELVGIMLACLFLGQWLDHRYSTKGLAMIGLSVLGLVGWLVQVIQLAKGLDKKEDSNS